MIHIEIRYKNTTINYSDIGVGLPIVLLHGYLENIKMWGKFTSMFTQRNRMICIDLLGHGETGCLGYIHTMEEQAEMVNYVLNELKIEKAILIGHSMGGYVSLAFAEKYAQKTIKLCLLNSTSIDDSEERKKNRDRAIKMVKKDYVSFVSLSIANLFSTKNREILLSEIEVVKKDALKTPVQGIIAALEGMKVRKNRETVLANARFPICLILSKNDPVLDYIDTRKQIQNTKVMLKTLDAGHMSQIENYQQLHTIFKEFIT